MCYTVKYQHYALVNFKSVFNLSGSYFEKSVLKICWIWQEKWVLISVLTISFMVLDESLTFPEQAHL